MHALARGLIVVPVERSAESLPRDRAAHVCGSDKPTAPSVPSASHVRREIPSHSRDPSRSFSNSSIGGPCSGPASDRSRVAGPCHGQRSQKLDFTNEIPAFKHAGGRAGGTPVRNYRLNTGADRWYDAGALASDVCISR